MRGPVNSDGRIRARFFINSAAESAFAVTETAASYPSLVQTYFGTRRARFVGSPKVVLRCNGLIDEYEGFGKDASSRVGPLDTFELLDYN